MFDVVDGKLSFHGVAVEEVAVRLGERSLRLMALRDAADLLDSPEFARQFEEEDRAPYGLQLWPAAIMLAECVVQNSEGHGRSAIDLGTGLGLTAMAATLAGWRVVATDNDPNALRFARCNARLNEVPIESFELLDWHKVQNRGRYDLILAADVLYQRIDFTAVLGCVEQLLSSEGRCIVADPCRSIADDFCKLARSHGFDVEVRAAAAPDYGGRMIRGRLFHLRRRVGVSSNGIA